MLTKYFLRLLCVWLPLAAILLFFWNSPLAYPVKLLSVFFHEMSHAITAWALGGQVNGMVINADETGATWYSVNKDSFTFIRQLLVGNAGYVGSVICGGMLLVVATKLRYKRAVSVMLGIALVLLAFAFRVSNPFGWWFTAATSLGLVLIGCYGKEWANDWLLRLAGFASCLFALADMKKSVLSSNWAMGDAMIMKELTGVPIAVWEILWSSLALIATLWFLWLLEKRPARVATKQLPQPSAVQQAA